MDNVELLLKNKLNDQSYKQHNYKYFYLKFIVDRLEICNLNFSIENYCIIKDINISAKTGDIVGIDSKRYLEKDILIKLLLKIYDSNPYNYALIDESGNRLEGPEILDYIAYIPKKTLIPNKSIIEFIRDGNKKIDLESIERVCQFVGINDYIKTLPKGIESELDKSKTPYNRIREIEMVKAILKNVPIIIIDEPEYTINNDDKSIIEVIKKLSTNHIIILSIYNDDIKNICNKIIKLNNLENRKTFYDSI